MREYIDIVQKLLIEAEIIKFPGNKKPISNLAVAQGGANVYGFPENIPLDDFQHAYVQAALWSSTDDNGEPLDRDFGIKDIATPTLKKMIKDCDDFRHENQDALEQFHEHGFDDVQAGRDFWLTRNRHGSGFWDREVDKKLGDTLTQAAHRFDDYTLYLGDDHMIHGM